MFQTVLLRAGFAFPQKSLAWKWVRSAEKADSIQNKIGDAVPSGHLLSWRIPDQVFAGGRGIENGVEKDMQKIPDPWIIHRYPTFFQKKGMDGIFEWE